MCVAMTVSVFPVLHCAKKTPIQNQMSQLTLNKSCPAMFYIVEGFNCTQKKATENQDIFNLQLGRIKEVLNCKTFCNI